MCVVMLFTFSHGSTNSNLKVSQRSPLARIIYHCIAFGQLLLFVFCNIWIILFVCFTEAFYKSQSQHGDDFEVTKFILYLGMVIVLIHIWIVAATGGLGEIRWWPSRDRLSGLVPPSIKNTTMMKCRWSLLFYQS